MLEPFEAAWVVVGDWVVHGREYSNLLVVMKKKTKRNYIYLSLILSPVSFFLSYLVIQGETGKIKGREKERTYKIVKDQLQMSLSSKVSLLLA